MIIIVIVAMMAPLTGSKMIMMMITTLTATSDDGKNYDESLALPTNAHIHDLLHQILFWQKFFPVEYFYVFFWFLLKTC